MGLRRVRWARAPPEPTERSAAAEWPTYAPDLDAGIDRRSIADVALRQRVGAPAARPWSDSYAIRPGINLRRNEALLS
jgi:hypothetical protein